ncbi:MAG TPA: mechanosensitive ion channel family protein [Ktedonobacterales bacterium]
MADQGLSLASAGAIRSVSGISALAQPPDALAVRVGLTALVLLLALGVGPKLAEQVSASSRPADVKTGYSPRQSATNEAEARSGWRRWLAAVALGCIWLAAASIIAVIWLWDTRGFLPSDPHAIFTAAGYVVTRIAVSLLVLAVTLALARGLDTGVELGLQRGHVNKNLLVLAGHAIYLFTILVGVIVILVVWGISLVVPVTLIGVLTVALSLALQDILKNIVAGVYLLIERPFVIGDLITVGAFTGIVEDIQIRVTWLHTPDGQLALVPNSTLFMSPVVNSSYYERRRISLLVTLDEQGPDGIEQVQQHILAELDGVPGIRSEPPPAATLNRSTAGKVELRADFWVPTNHADGPRTQSAIVSEAIERLRMQMPEAEIAIAPSAASTPSSS